MDEINNYRLEKLINVGAKIQNKGTLYMINGISSCALPTCIANIDDLRYLNTGDSNLRKFGTNTLKIHNGFTQIM